jgi:hypothetical protein
MMASMSPYQNESESLALGELTVENRLDRVSLYGALDIPRDKAGLAQARALKEIVDAVVAALEKEGDLPDKVRTKPAQKVKNPFG